MLILIVGGAVAGFIGGGMLTKDKMEDAITEAAAELNEKISALEAEKAELEKENEAHKNCAKGNHDFDKGDKCEACDAQAGAAVYDYYNGSDVTPTPGMGGNVTPGTSSGIGDIPDDILDDLQDQYEDITEGSQSVRPVIVP